MWSLDNMSNAGSASGIDWAFAEVWATLIASPIPSSIARERSTSPPVQRSSSPSIGVVKLVRRDCTKCLKTEEKERQKRKQSFTW